MDDTAPIEPDEPADESASSGDDPPGDREPGVPPPDNDDLTGYDEVLAESFPASDPPQLY